MKILAAACVIALGCLFTAEVVAADKAEKEAKKEARKEQKKEGMLQHVVAFKFKADASKEQIDKVLTAFEELPKKISVIKKFQTGINNSPEGLNKGFTHGWIISFKNEKDRDVYLHHAEHQAFVSIAKPVLDDVFVIDFWGGK
jgi:hypothetical protein